jgi:hypothetical protein
MNEIIKEFSISNSDLQFENKDNFNFIKIDLNNLEELKWTDPLYLDKILDLNIFTNININSNNFLDIVVEALDVNKYNDNSDAMIETQIIAEFHEFIYEMSYINNIKKDDQIKNDLASLLITNGETIYGNAIIFKTFLSVNSDTNIFFNIEKNDIKSILENRVKTSVVIYDGEWSETVVIGNLEDYAKEFFDDNFIKYEIPFLKHNINIWYEKLEGCSTIICGKLLNKPIYKCLWFTMISDEYRGTLTLDEVTKIIKLSNHLTFPYEPLKEWITDEKDIYGKNKIVNKYRILEKACKKYLVN